MSKFTSAIFKCQWTDVYNLCCRISSSLLPAEATEPEMTFDDWADQSKSSTFTSRCVNAMRSQDFLEWSSLTAHLQCSDSVATTSPRRISHFLESLKLTQRQYQSSPSLQISRKCKIMWHRVYHSQRRLVLIGSFIATKTMYLQESFQTEGKKNLSDTGALERPFQRPAASIWALKT